MHCLGSRSVTGTSNYIRNTRELQLQGEGSENAISHDHTYSVNGNYETGVLNNCKACTSTMTTGERIMASTATVPGTSTADFAQQFEQVAGRLNLNPKASVTDKMPTDINFSKKSLEMLRIYCLGLFHFIQCIVKTLQKGYVDYVEAV